MKDPAMILVRACSAGALVTGPWDRGRDQWWHSYSGTWCEHEGEPTPIESMPGISKYNELVEKFKALAEFWNTLGVSSPIRGFARDGILDVLSGKYDPRKTKICQATKGFMACRREYGHINSDNKGHAALNSDGFLEFW